MIISLFLKGLVIGFLIAAPVGPIGILCIQRTLSHGKSSGLATGLGAATADGFYGVVAALGLTTISNFLIGYNFWFKFFGGLFLLYLGIKLWFKKSSGESIVDRHKNIFFDYFSTVFLTLANPATILSFAAIFAGLGIANSNNDASSATLMVLGVVIGSALWWLVLSYGVHFFRSKIKLGSFAIINKISGSIMIAFGFFSLISLI
jgi:threonine/homoserine/homoserine lactone efflux protein